MGNKCPEIILRLFDHPVKRRPICFLRQDEFSAMGEPLEIQEPVQQEEINEYDELMLGFYSRFAQQRLVHLEEAEAKEKIEGKVPRKFVGWDEMTISNLQSLFVNFDKNMNGKLNYEDFATILESLGDSSSNIYRKRKFDEVDLDLDGFIILEDYLHIIYNFDVQDGENLKGLAKLCKDIAADIEFMGSLSVGEQIEHGLF